MLIEGEVMLSRYAKWLAALILGGIITISALNGTWGWPSAEPEHDLSLQKTIRPLVIAHRGGGGLWPENTLLAFERARDLGVDMIETDVHSTADGVLVVMHDAAVDRTTGATGRLNDLTLAEIKKLDAGYRWSADGMKTFPWRGRGLTVPTLDEVFTSLPDMRFNIEPKQEKPSLAKPLCRMIREKGMVDKVTVGSFRQTVLDEFRRECPEVITSASPAEVSEFVGVYKSKRDAAYRPLMRALQVPEYIGGMRVIDKDFVEAAHLRNLQVHVWTVNEKESMRRLIGIGVDGIMTDYPDRLMDLLGRARTN
jgi:glycerophosphoryl diester phosphodiesterase